MLEMHNGWQSDDIFEIFHHITLKLIISLDDLILKPLSNLSKINWNAHFQPRVCLMRIRSIHIHMNTDQTFALTKVLATILIRLHFFQHLLFLFFSLSAFAWLNSLSGHVYVCGIVLKFFHPWRRITLVNEMELFIYKNKTKLKELTFPSIIVCYK